jgi:hypothetical protein
MSESDLTLNPTKAKQKRWDRPTITAKIAAFQNRPSKTISQRQFANEQGMPRKTLQYWLARKDSIDADPALTAFFESPIGLAFLHRLQVAAHLVFNQVGPCGIRLICCYLELTGLDRFVAASVGAQPQIARQMESEIIAYGAREKSRLANTMPAKKITVCEDETFHHAIGLLWKRRFESRL